MNARATSKPRSTDSATTNATTYDTIQRGVWFEHDALTPHPENYNHHPETQVLELCASLQEFGQVDDIIVWPHTDGGQDLVYIVGGEGIWTAAGRLEMAGLYCTVVPASWSYVKVKRYLIANNTLSRHADPDQTQLAMMLDEQRKAGNPLDALGYDDGQLDALLAEVGADGAFGDDEDGAPPTFKDYDESIEDGMDTEMCAQCGKLCLKSNASKPK